MYFSDATKTKNGWANELLHEFECNVEMLKQAMKDHNVGSPPMSPTHASPQHTQTGISPTDALDIQTRGGDEGRVRKYFINIISKHYLNSKDVD